MYITRDFYIADFLLRISGEDWEEPFGHFGRALARFERPVEADLQPTLHLLPDQGEKNRRATMRELDSFDFAELNATCHLYGDEEGHLLTIHSEKGSEMWFSKERNSEKGYFELKSQLGNPELSSLIRFGVWILFGLAITPHHAIAIHSSTIQCGAGASLFLGESGTGKSTHTRLWRTHIEGAKLLNDDSPIIRIREGVPTVYGSPWSGKTPCYKNESYPIRGFVRLSQAPHNRMRRLGVIPAIGALLPSCPPSFAHDAKLQDAICDTLSEFIALTPVYHLECLPDEAAARLSYSTLYDGTTLG